MELTLSREQILQVLGILPVIALVPLLSVLIPIRFQGVREVANYYQSLALVESGLHSFLYVTLQETDAGLHLYSILSTPFVAAGYVEGGRLVSAIAAVLTALIIGRLAGKLWGTTAALLAPPALLANAYYFRFAWASQPEAVSIVLTVGSVVTLLQFFETDNRRWFGGSLLLLILAISNHSWEATIALPLVALLLYEQRWRDAATVGLVTVGAVVAVRVLTGLQPNPANPTSTYSVVGTGMGIYFTPQFTDYFTRAPYWTWTNISSVHPFGLAYTSHFPGGMAIATYYTGKSVYSRFTDRTALLLASWSVSGLSILFVLPGGLNHHYYAWALIIPVTLSGVAAVHRVIQLLKSVIGAAAANYAVTGFVGLLVVLAMMNGMVFEAGIGPTGAVGASDGGVPSATSNTEELVQAGYALREYSVDSSKSVAFIGDWEGRPLAISQVLMYGEVMVRNTWKEPSGQVATVQPLESAELSEIENCSVAVIQHEDNTVEVSEC